MTLAEVVAIVTGGCSGTGREIARGLASRGWAIVLVYLEQQRTAEAAVAEILAAEGKVVAVRADLADDLDVQRLFAESSAAFGRVDAVAHTATGGASILYRHAAGHLRRQGVIVSLSPAEPLGADVERELRERGIDVVTARPDVVLGLLDRWRRQL